MKKESRGEKKGAAPAAPLKFSTSRIRLSPGIGSYISAQVLYGIH
jgi:hypothetical protein